MIFKRAVARLRGQDWLAITIELAIVIIGAFAAIFSPPLATGQRLSDMPCRSSKSSHEIRSACPC
jgi:hypothetical protein